MRIPSEKSEMKVFLEEMAGKFNSADFIESDPISIPHGYKRKEDIEIAGFLTATISWGKRKSILSNAARMMSLLDNSPYDFVLNHGTKDLKSLGKFVHRTFNSADLITFILALRNIYERHGGLESAFTSSGDLQTSLASFPDIFFETDLPDRSRKHVADIRKSSSAKRINMFLRWMVRSDDRGVDFGLWKKVSPSQLFIPLDVHTGNTARKLGLLTRKQNDWKAVVELTGELRSFDPSDPVRFDYALFGLGVSGII